MHLFGMYLTDGTTTTRVITDHLFNMRVTSPSIVSLHSTPKETRTPSGTVDLVRTIPIPANLSASA
jgi:hypothetical protein